MINSISTASQMPSFAMQQSSNQQLTSEQTQLLEDTLADLDPNSMSEAQAQTIVETLETAGIEPNAALAQSMSTLGFDAQSIGELAGVKGGGQGSMPPPPPPSGDSSVAQLELSDDQFSELDSLLTSLYEEENSESNKATLLSNIQQLLQEGSSESGLLNVTV
jgi:hypothetical protein